MNNTHGFFHLYLDLDGVFGDFQTAWEEIYGEMYTTFDAKKFNEFIFKHEGFVKLPVMQRGHELYNELKNMCERHGGKISFLSSLGTPHGRLQQQEVVRQKRLWLRGRMGWYDHAYFTNHKGNKKLFAAPNAILIDDTFDNVVDFNKSGGYGILYSEDNYTNVIRQLANVIDSIHQQYDFGIYEEVV